MAQPEDAAIRGSWIATVMFTAVFTLHAMDRYVISVVLEPIRHEFGLTDTQLGALGGMAHAIAFSVFALPVGWLLDRTNRVRLLAAMVGIWSGLTMLGAFATSYWQLFAMRMGVGAAESSSSPAVMSLIASLFPPKARASAMGVVFSGVALGTGAIFAVGGTIADRWGWEYVFLVAGAPGILLSAFMWFRLEEPPRRAVGAGTETRGVPIRQAVAFAIKTPPVLFSILGLTMASMTVVSAWTWITPILVREQSFSLAEAGFVVGIAAGVMKFGSTFLSGFLGDWIAKGRIDRLWIVPAIALLLSLPVAACIAFVPSKVVVSLCVLVLGLTLGTHYAAPRVVIVSVTPEHMRGSVSSFEALSSNLVGAGLGPLITGLISDLIGGPESVSVALLAILSLNILAALCLWLASKGARDAEERVFL